MISTDYKSDAGCERERRHMEKFRAQEGLIHFVFGNEDTYILDSMVQLNLTDYLYYEL